MLHFRAGRQVVMGRFDLTDFDWSVIEPLLPTTMRGVKRADIPARHGPRTTCVNRFDRWRKAGRWSLILQACQRLTMAASR